jgi:hypothetical protein|eukprot:SAG25_NODE_584_length_6756_cov_2.948776_8_plen_89_part_00
MGGGAILCPKRQYHIQESHPLLWTTESFNDTNAQIQAVMKMLTSNTATSKPGLAVNRSFGGFPLGRTVYLLRHIITALKGVAELHHCT